MSALMGVVVSPITPSTTGTKRSITPSRELSASKRVLRALVLETLTKKLPRNSPGAEVALESFSPPKQLSPGGVGQIVEEYSHAHLAQTPQTEQQPKLYTKHVLLPFKDINVRGKETQKIMRTIFPNTDNVGISGGGSHLIFQVKKLPMGPWPLTVGGLPFTIMDNDGEGRALIFHFLVLGSPGSIYLPGVDLREVMYTSEHLFYVILEQKLPFKIANRPTRYLNDKDIPRPDWANLQARRDVDPGPLSGVVDDAAYNSLRPGVMIHSRVARHTHPQEFSTTSGILVNNSVGETLMTAAAHGIGEEGAIYQPGCEQKIIGEAQHVIPNTYICLIQLSDGITFQNETFENTAGVITRFSRLVDDSDNIIKDLRICHLNSPYTGHMQAVVVATSLRCRRGLG
ncbi:hypothetical protein BX600DRAFT_435208 [Xylariales sp. PMI_506]|nr:hypothetical protein BX600DRAFT_435208 [Xylariales sp. PMI_506]